MSAADAPPAALPAEIQPPPGIQGIVRPARRPPGWVAPGPRPVTPQGRPELWPGPGEDLCYLAGDFRILQRLDGHRWSADDLLSWSPTLPSGSRASRSWKPLTVMAGASSWSDSMRSTPAAARRGRK